MSETLRALDVSSLADNRVITRAEWTRARAAGFEVAIVGAHYGVTTNPHTEASLAAARAAGMLTATYITIGSPTGGLRLHGEGHVDRGLSACGDEWEHLSFCAVDVEIDGVTVAEIARAVAAVEAEEQRPVIYTGRWFWLTHLDEPDPINFAHLPLWSADYDGVAALDFPLHYGGWTDEDLVGKQYRGWSQQREITDFHPDLNVFDAAWVRAWPVRVPELDHKAAVNAVLDAYFPAVLREESWLFGPAEEQEPGWDSYTLRRRRRGAA